MARRTVKTKFRLNVYRNPDSQSLRVDLAIPAGPIASDRLYSYVGTLLPAARDGKVTFEGKIRALDSDLLRRDSNAATTCPGIGKLLIAEQPALSPRSRKRTLLATFALASGRYAIEATYSSREVFIVGRRLLENAGESTQSRLNENKPRTKRKPRTRRQHED